MFTKVLATDDLGSINKGVFTVVKGLGIQEVQQVMYCDDAYLRIKKATNSIHHAGEIPRKT